MLIGKINNLVLESVLLIYFPRRHKGLNAIESATYNFPIQPDNMLSRPPDNNYYEAAGLINRLLCEKQNMKKLIALIFLLSSVSQATEDLCYQKGAEASHIFNQVMEPSVYSVKVTDHGSEDPAEVLISVPEEYRDIPIMGITVKIGGYNGFATDIATTTESGKVLGGFYIAKADLSKVKVLANYQSTEPCEGIKITKEFISYNVPISHNKRVN